MTGNTPEVSRKYRRTLFDRHGPDAWRFYALGTYAIVIFAMSALLFALRAHRLHLSVLGTLGFVLAGGAALTIVLLVIIGFASDALGASFRVFMEGSSSTPYEEQFSREDALVMQGDVAAALASFEQRIREPRSGVAVRLRAAELYAGPGRDPKRAAELLRDARELPEVAPQQEVYVANRLVDLFTGPLDDPGRALVELRRLVDRFPGSSAAGHARAAISNLKSDRPDRKPDLT